MNAASEMEQMLGLQRRAVAIRFQQSVPEGISRIDESAVSGCTYWKLAAEAAHLAGASSDTSRVGRPTCAAVPAVMKSGTTATNLGCIENRVYTGLADDEPYFVIAGPQLAAIVGELATIVNANNELETFHQGCVTS